MKQKLTAKHILVALSVCISGVTAGARQDPAQGPLQGPNILNNSLVQTGLKKTKGLVVVFLSAQCPCSNSHIEELKSLHKDFPDFEFVGVHSNMDEELDISKEYFLDKKLPFPVIQDSKASLADQLKAKKTPHVFIFDANKNILYEGGVSDSSNFQSAEKKYLRDSLKELSQNKEITNKKTRTLGCEITR